MPLQLGLTVGMFYNDRIFGEILALLRALKLSTYGWIKLIHDDIAKLPVEIQALYEGFTRDTEDELWETPEALARDVSKEAERYAKGELGGNIIYKYRAKSFIEHFDILHKTAFSYLQKYVRGKDIDVEKAVHELERFSRYQKLDLFNVDYAERATFDYDIPRLLMDPAFARNGGTLEDLHYPVTLQIEHTERQRASITRELKFYGRDIDGLTMLISRYPVKRFWRRAEPADGVVPVWQNSARLEVVGA